jgi:hypothetical protein
MWEYEHDEVDTFQKKLRLEVRVDGIVVPVAFFARHNHCELRLVDKLESADG